MAFLEMPTVFADIDELLVPFMSMLWQETPITDAIRTFSNTEVEEDMTGAVNWKEPDKSPKTFVYQGSARFSMIVTAVS